MTVQQLTDLIDKLIDAKLSELNPHKLGIPPDALVLYTKCYAVKMLIEYLFAQTACCGIEPKMPYENFVKDNEGLIEDIIDFTKKKIEEKYGPAKS